MHRANDVGSSQFYHYWRGRVLDTQLRLSRTDSHQLRGVYSQLLGHYQRMAQLYDAAAARPNRARHCPHFARP
jgi:hypothetical protein